MPYSRLFSEHIDPEQEKHHLQIQQNRCCSRTHYEVLGINKSATSKEIRQSFIKLSKKLHPDINKDPKTHERFIKINEAYSTLIKPSNRKDYDQTLAYRVKAKQYEASTVYGPHTSGSSSRPGFQHEAGADEGQFYYDETLWHWRDQAEDKNYEQQAEQRGYYGFKGINRIANHRIVLGCLGLIIFGGMMHYFTFYQSRSRQVEKMNERDQKLAAYHTSARKDAKRFGNEYQLERLKAIAAANKYTTQNDTD
ncbi:dnaJ-like protein 60 [Gigantopelta aegis]|uniref:dnaJ-like protein 60 n=1 Tax=Gigantopelta aegis TaxID=1735272 RepID=UPI001B88C823|nr:dnaJ-like protein 60 [Gigantopelta aegis]XP_041353140.1 dnaJ-like protein 60 [Gigantopelta aegis]